MASFAVPIEVLLAHSIRVRRDITTAEDLVAAWPSLKQKSLSSPSTLTDSERRLLLDLPNEDMEISNISTVTSPSREQLLEKAVSNREILTEEEVLLLKDRFWGPAPETSTKQSLDFRVVAASTEAFDELVAAREPAYTPNEDAAFVIGRQEFYRRLIAANEENLRATAERALPYAKEWIECIYRQEKMHWGFICLYDAAAQQLPPARLEKFTSQLGQFFQHTLMYNGSKDIIDRKWTLLPFNGPKTAFAPVATLVGETAANRETDYQCGAILREAFQEILKNPQAYERAACITSLNPPFHQFKDGITGSGLLTNTFLVIDPVCIDYVLEKGRWYDDRRILAFEADFPAPGREYIEGYQGFTWVRLDQLVYNFYELRLLKADEVGIDEMWKAAQDTRNQAFVSMDPEEASIWTKSNWMSGYYRESVLGRRWYPMKEARDLAEQNART